MITSHRESSIIALAGDDFGLRVLDTETKLTVRELWGHRNRILDMVMYCLFQSAG